jgi:alpha-amylase/alpha-mannosidase (GH57 family)
MPSEKPEIQKYLCVHGHFYQPPRENPWLDTIERQETAFPYHDWNERVTRECYGPNSRGRLHGKEGRILKLLNNYEYMSFNFGPTLLMWLEDKHPWIYAQIISADKASRVRYKGHGNALAQVYNHIIMPLASPRDRLTQIRWGLEDFRHRFGRDAEGMWLAETAVDSQTLKIMADEGIRFTILSPTQAKAVRPLEKGHDSSLWQDVSEGRIDPSRPYRIILDRDGKLHIDVFFYDGPLSRAIAYEKILSSGADLLSQIKYIFNNHKDGPRLISIATDGESYGHHFKFGEMALTWLFDHVDRDREIGLTNFGMFLEMFPPENEVKIFENSSWSCAHGIERWRSDCGCSVGKNPAWKQTWRSPLRQGLDWLSSELSVIFEERASRLLKDPWMARDEYMILLLDRSWDRKMDFINSHSTRPINDDEQIEIFSLMESQRMALYMFTSCGWFFDDISGIEAMQVLMYASRAIDLVRPWSKKHLESGLIGFLKKAKSNERRYGNGAKIYEDRVKLSRIDPSLLTAHYAIASLVRNFKIEPWLSESIHVIWEKDIDINGLRINLGVIDVDEKMTGRSFRKTYLAIWGKNANTISCLVGKGSDLNPERLSEEIRYSLNISFEQGISAFRKQATDIKSFDLNDLNADMRKSITDALANNLFSQIRESIAAHYGSLQDYLALLHESSENIPSFLDIPFRLLFIDDFLRVLDTAPGKKVIDFDPLLRSASLTGSLRLKDSRGKAAVEFLGDILKEVKMLEGVQGFLRRNMYAVSQSNNIVPMQNIINLLEFMRGLNTEPDLWECQNLYFDLSKDNRYLSALAPDGHKLFQILGQTLGFVTEES